MKLRKIEMYPTPRSLTELNGWIKDLTSEQRVAVYYFWGLYNNYLAALQEATDVQSAIARSDNEPVRLPTYGNRKRTH